MFLSLIYGFFRFAGFSFLSSWASHLLFTLCYLNQVVEYLLILFPLILISIKVSIWFRALLQFQTSSEPFLSGRSVLYFTTCTAWFQTDPYCSIEYTTLKTSPSYCCSRVRCRSSFCMSQRDPFRVNTLKVNNITFFCDLLV